MHPNLYQTRTMVDIAEDNRKRVGIVGYWYATNYGSVATYYALSRVLSEMDYNVMLIDIPEKEKDPAGEGVFSRTFLKNHCNITPSVKWDDIQTLNDYCDSFVVGSDQVWTKDAMRITRDMFFLNFVLPEKKKIAYAPSFGTEQFILDINEEDKVRNYLRLFDSISIRENTGKDILMKMFNIDAEHVLDPVFLIDKKEYFEIAEESKLNTEGDYILAYILDPTPDKEKAIFEVQTSLDIPVKIILDGRINTFDKNRSKFTEYDECIISDVNEEDWVKGFRDANFVITDSHHGLAMAIIFQKQVIAYANRKRGYTRFTSLMSLLSISDYLIEDSTGVSDLINNPMNYKNIQRKLNKEKKRSIAWLKSAMEFETPKNNVAYGLDLKAKCTGCSTCECICPKDAIVMKPNYDGFLNPQIDFKKCINCGLCLKSCIALTQRYINTPNPACFAVWADEETRLKSSSGGMFSLAATSIINDGGCVFGAKYTDDFNVKHTMVDGMSNLDALRGSKYIQSNMSKIYPQVKSQIETGRSVLFTGMPCQVAGLYSYLGKDYDNLYTIDILCHGISSYKVFSKYHNDVLEDKKIKSLHFKAKKPWGWHAGVNATFEDNTDYSKIIEIDPYFVAYIKGLSRNLACEVCPFNCLPRQGNITIGDFWKIGAYNKKMDDNKGTSVVLTNNPKGKHLFEKSSINMTLKEEVPISYAKAGNGCITYSYKLHPNRRRFFSELDSTEFQDLVSELDVSLNMPPGLSVEQQELFCLSKYTYSKYKNRTVVLWGDESKLRDALLKYFKIKVPFIVTSDQKNISGNWVRHIDTIRGKSNEYFVIAYGRAYDQEGREKYLKGYIDTEDFVYRIMKPIVLKDLDLSKGTYSDAYGNIIKGKGTIKQIVLRGFNNQLTISGTVHGLNRLKVDLTANSRIYIDEGCNFTQDFMNIDVQGYDGHAMIHFNSMCRFMNSLIRLYVSPYESSITIGEKTTFGDNLRMHANSGKKIVIGKDSMVSHDVVFWAGDGHSIFDVKTGKNINSVFSNQPDNRNVLSIGEHVWIGDRAMLLHGTNVGTGSIVGANSVVKGKYPTNCSIGGNPSKIIRKDIAWCHTMVTGRIECCGEYAKLTDDTNPAISGLNILVIGGSQNNGKSLVEFLLANGNIVTLANRGRTPDSFGDLVSRIIVDVSDYSSIVAGLKDKSYDVVFNNLAYSSNQVRNILSTVKCKRYVQLSSVSVYSTFHTEMEESEFNPFCSGFIWSNADSDYRKGKQNAECAVFQEFKDVPSVVVRIPYVTWDPRLNFYCESIVNEKAMNIYDTERRITFIRSSEVGKFLAWVAAQDFNGVVNLSSSGSVMIRDILEYIEKKTGKTAIIDDKSKNISPYSDPSYSLNVSKIENMGYKPSDLDEWFWETLDVHINLALKK